MTPGAEAGQPIKDPRERLTRLLVVQIFFVFFQGFMVAPLLPRFAVLFHTTLGRASALVPAYTLPYGIVCLVVGPLADRLGRARVIRWLLLAGVALPALCASAASIDQLVAWRVLAGLGLGGLAPVTLALIAEAYPYAERGRPVGWVFGAIAGGMALGASGGPWLEAVIGWRVLFVLVSVGSAAAAVPLHRTLASWPPSPAPPPLGALALAKQYVALATTRRGSVAYGYVFLNGVFHSGVFSWLGVYFVDRYALSPGGVGLALLGYGIPGFLFGPVLGRAADRHGRRGILRVGLLLAAVCALVLRARLPIWGATVTITALSLGFDMTHPLFAGFITSLDPKRTAQAMALNTFAVFVGFGVGSAVFGALYLGAGMSTALLVFGDGQLVLAALSGMAFDKSWR